ncbi:protein of unknown function [Corynebacterium coyleae]|uniref:ImmA/IrrE family metallo-endopeptidase n=2 Tax=Corynebacterium coyleae TaxID=53374 RepID=A0ABX8KVC3_9CORY|nr:ImmA/IrrE family metallo-endopeptidase [Corynebacterium coyleae]WJY79305.1 hypothetical protein CCOY_03430 [Corynebacterium coyleae]SEB74222.1 protein of unknown function [Corynebacterium coyleae]
MAPSYVDLLDMASRLGVWVDVDDVGWLEGGETGGWFPEHDLILLAPGLHPIEQRCTLAHELGHVTHEHRAGITGWLKARQEQQADRFAATLLISPIEYELAERLYGHSPNLLAQELDVTTNIVTTWQRLYERTHVRRPAPPPPMR